MRRFAFLTWLLSVALAAVPADARTTIKPYIEVQQVFTADLTGHQQDAVTYTGAAAGVDITLDGPHVQGQLDYRYDHYFSWSRKYRDTDVHNGLASIVYQPDPDLSLNAAGIATRARGTFGQRTPGFLFGDLNNTQQIYSIQAGPSYTHRAGDLTMAADYRFGWTRSTDGVGEFDLGPGQPVLQNNFTTIDHVVDASVGTRPGGLGLPFGWKVSGGWTRDEVHFLDARLTGYYGRADATLPVSSSVALEAGAGYEKDRASQAAILTDADGNAILDDHRHLQADHSRKRLLSYDQHGLIWDVGVLWRPSARTSLEVRGGQRYGETVVTGRFQHQISPTASVQVVAYDDIQSFGRQLSSDVGGLPTSFNSFAAPIPTTLAGCVFGANGGQGGCIPALSSVNSNFYRSRGVYMTLSGSRGPWVYGLGLGYDHRHYFAPDFGPQLFSFNGANEQSVTVDGVLVRNLSAVSSLSLTALGAWYDSDAFDTPSYFTYGVAASYSRAFSRHLSGTASISISSGSGGNFDDDVIGTALLAVRYTL